MSSLRDSNRIILIGGIKFGDLVLSIVEGYLIQRPFLGVSVKRDSTVVGGCYGHSCFPGSLIKKNDQIFSCKLGGGRVKLDLGLMFVFAYYLINYRTTTVN